MSYKFDFEELKEYLIEDFDVFVVGIGMYGKLLFLFESREFIKGKEVFEFLIKKVVEV